MKTRMKAMVCEMCGGNEVLKTGGMYVCQYCGTKYDVAEARKLIVTVSGPVAVDGVATADNLMDRAQEYFDKGNQTKALEYVNRVLDIDAHDERARSMQRRIEEGGGALSVVPQRYVSPHTNVCVGPTNRDSVCW